MAKISLNPVKVPKFEEIVIAENDRDNRFTVSVKAGVILRMGK